MCRYHLSVSLCKALVSPILHGRTTTPNKTLLSSHALNYFSWCRIERRVFCSFVFTLLSSHALNYFSWCRIERRVFCSFVFTVCYLLSSSGSYFSIFTNPASKYFYVFPTALAWTTEKKTALHRFFLQNGTLHVCSLARSYLLLVLLLSVLLYRWQ